ncbi:MAG: L-seryl-tRNA(Sec) selenium transferase, partial [Anaerolineaceae bacterium]
MDDPRRNLPSVEQILTRLRRDGLSEANRITHATEAARDTLAAARSAVSAGSPVPSVGDLAAEVRERMMHFARPPLRPVINATGVILQTNLGRAPLSDLAIAAMSAVAAGYSNLEYDLVTGSRGSRHSHLSELLRRTTGAEDGIVVNNNAAAILMVLQVFAAGREVIISRGQAVEIGGGFRIPDVLRQSGAVLRDVGTTNRTYARDYAAAWGPDSAAILRVHSSNFKIV